MAKYALMHMGFEMPGPEQMQLWKAWFEKIAPHTLENIGFRAAREVTSSGVQELPFDKTAITGLSIVEAEDMDAAQALTEGNPFVSAIRIYEIMQHGG
jgi:hypothetical protein